MVKVNPMVTILVLLVFLGSIGLLYGSKKAILPTKYNYQSWLARNPFRSKMLGCLLCVLSLIGAIMYLGLGSGFFFWLVSFMTSLSLLVLFNPIKLVSHNQLLLLFLICLCIEIL